MIQIMSTATTKSVKQKFFFFASNGFTLNEIQAILSFKPLFEQRFE